MWWELKSPAKTQWGLHDAKAASNGLIDVTPDGKYALITEKGAAFGRKRSTPRISHSLVNDVKETDALWQNAAEINISKPPPLPWRSNRNERKLRTANDFEGESHVS